MRDIGKTISFYFLKFFFKMYCFLTLTFLPSSSVMDQAQGPDRDRVGSASFCQIRIGINSKQTKKLISRLFSRKFLYAVQNAEKHLTHLTLMRKHSKVAMM